jgi:hypothetical protein
MAYNGSGSFVRLYNWITDRNGGIKIQAAKMDAEMDGFATGLSNALCRDGQSTVTANIPMNGKKLTGLGDATVGTDALNLQSGDTRYAGLASPVFTGNPTAPTPTVGDNDTSIATTAFVQTAVGGVGGGVTTFNTRSGAVTLSAADLAASLYTSTAIASASTTDILGAATQQVTISGSNTITSLGTGASRIREVTFSGAAVLTHNATTLILPGGANITAAAGDTAIFVSDASSNVRCISYQRATGKALTPPDQSEIPNSAGFPSGTLMLFQQTAAPTGWTKQTTHNDKALRVVSGTASSGGTTAFSTVMASRTPAGTVGNTALTAAQVPAFTTIADGQTGAFSTFVTGSTGNGANHTHSFTGTAMDFAVQYVDLIIASKN